MHEKRCLSCLPAPLTGHLPLCLPACLRHAFVYKKERTSCIVICLQAGLPHCLHRGERAALLPDGARQAGLPGVNPSGVKLPGVKLSSGVKIAGVKLFPCVKPSGVKLAASLPPAPLCTHTHSWPQRRPPYPSLSALQFFYSQVLPCHMVCLAAPHATPHPPTPVPPRLSAANFCDLMPPVRLAASPLHPAPASAPT